MNHEQHLTAARPSIGIITASDEANIVDVYSAAMKDARQRGGPTCTTTPIEYTDGRFLEVNTVCGQCKLVYFLPRKGIIDGKETPVATALWISVGR